MAATEILQFKFSLNEKKNGITTNLCDMCYVLLRSIGCTRKLLSLKNLREKNEEPEQNQQIAFSVEGKNLGKFRGTSVIFFFKDKRFIVMRRPKANKS